MGLIDFFIGIWWWRMDGIIGKIGSFEEWELEDLVKIVKEQGYQVLYPFAQIISKLRVSKLLISGRYFSKFSKNSIVALRKSANDS